eukprot:2333331-Pyramimonas_sp.AAC.1
MGLGPSQHYTAAGATASSPCATCARDGAAVSLWLYSRTGIRKAVLNQISPVTTLSWRPLSKHSRNVAIVL